MAQTFLVDMLYSGCNVTGNTVGEDETILHYYAAPLAPLANTVTSQWSIPDEDIAACGRVES